MEIHHDTSRNHRTARQHSSEFQIFPTKERYQQKLLSADDLPDSGCGLWIAKVVQFRAPAQERRRKIWDNSGMLPTFLAEFDTILAEGLAFPVLLGSIFWISPFRCVASWLLPSRAFKIEGKHLHSCTTILPFLLEWMQDDKNTVDWLLWIFSMKHLVTDACTDWCRWVTLESFQE